MVGLWGSYLKDYYSPVGNNGRLFIRVRVCDWNLGWYRDVLLR